MGHRVGLLAIIAVHISSFTTPFYYSHNYHRSHSISFVLDKKILLKAGTTTTNTNRLTTTTATASATYRNEQKHFLDQQQNIQQQLGSFETIKIPNNETSLRRVQFVNWSNAVESRSYENVWDVQKALVDEHLQRLVNATSTSSSSSQFTSNSKQQQQQQQKCTGKDVILFLQHEPVYTLGTASNASFIIITNSSNTKKIPTVRIERGGEVTYHGPGQLVVYPILDLRGYKQDIHWYMRALEEVILLALHSVGITNATREDNVTGVWIQQQKIAALGIKVRRWITMHGLAINVEQSSKNNFDGIVPCGLHGCHVCCVNDWLEEDITVEEFSVFVKQAFEQVFQIQLI